MVTTNFRSPILQRIYTYIDSTEISIFDHELVKARNKAIKILNVLNGGPNGLIDLDKLRQMAYQGIPVTNKSGSSDLRGVVWRVLLGVYPSDPTQWEEKSKQYLETYNLWKSELIVTSDQISMEYDDQMQFARDF